MILPPGSILQKMHFLREIRNLPPGYFIEIGPGNGVLSQALLNQKWKGIVFELDKITADNLKKQFTKYLVKKQYKITTKDFFNFKSKKKVDLILASMVIEHFAPKKEKEFLRKSKSLLKKTGSLFCYVPGSPLHWGIEDKIAGHYRRYTTERIKKRLVALGWKPKKIEGLTFPLSNILLPMSNWLVRKYETKKLKLTLSQKTRLSGRRQVPHKTEFPFYYKTILNPFVLYPFHVLQLIFKKHPQCLTLFFRANPSWKPS